jgi:O-succinylbenzoate synthase
VPLFEKPAISDLLAQARVLSVPMRVKFRGVTHREVVLFEGSHGWTEWSPFLEYDDQEAAVWLRAALEFGFTPPPRLIRSAIYINATLAAVSPDRVEEQLTAFGSFRTVKIKVAEPGQSLEEDLARVRRVRELHPQAAIRLDANGGYDVATAIEVAKQLALESIDLEYFEQPVKTIDELAAVRSKLARIGVRVAADESVRKVSDPLEVAQANAADVLVIKAQPLGGIRSALEITNRAKLPVTVSSALETSVGISMGLHLAAALEVESFDAGLGTVALLAEDVCDEPFIAENSMLYVNRAVPSEAKLAKLAADSERVDWWQERLKRCIELV